MLRICTYGYLAFVGYSLYDNRIRLYYNHEYTKNIFNIKACPSLTPGKYYSTPYLANGVLQSYFGSSKQDKQIQPLTFTRELLKLPDGGTIALDWHTGVNADRQKLLVIFPGITGGSNSPYMHSFTSRAEEKGFNIVVVNARGMENAPITSAMIGHAGKTDDVEFVLRFLREKVKGVSLLGLGISMGGNLSLRYAGETREKCLLRALATVSAPYDLLVCSRFLSRNTPRAFISDYVLTKNQTSLLRKISPDLKSFAPDELLDFEDAINQIRSYKFDQHATCQIHKTFRTPEHYYNTVSCAPVLKNIKIQTFCLSSLDDAVIAPENIPYEEFSNNPNLILAVTRLGGHIGWFTGLRNPKRWCPEPVLEFLDSIYSDSKKI